MCFSKWWTWSHPCVCMAEPFLRMPLSYPMIIVSPVTCLPVKCFLSIQQLSQSFDAPVPTCMNRVASIKRHLLCLQKSGSSWWAKTWQDKIPLEYGHVRYVKKDCRLCFIYTLHSVQLFWIKVVLVWCHLDWIYLDFLFILKRFSLHLFLKHYLNTNTKRIQLFPLFPSVFFVSAVLTIWGYTWVFHWFWENSIMA